MVLPESGVSLTSHLATQPDNTTAKPIVEANPSGFKGDCTWLVPAAQHQRAVQTLQCNKSSPANAIIKLSGVRLFSGLDSLCEVAGWTVANENV